MLKNYIVENDLKGLVPELANYLWTGESNYTKQRITAEEIVLNDFISRSYKVAFLRIPYYLVGTTTAQATQTTSTTGTANTDRDIASRGRLVVNVSALSTDKTITVKLYGSNDGSNFIQVANLSNTLGTPASSVTISATGITSYTFAELYNYYRLDTTIGSATSITFEAYLTETIYDLLYKYKWLELILNDSIKKNDQFLMKRDYFKESYDNLMSKGHFYYDENQDDDLTEDEQQRGNIITFIR